VNAEVRPAEAADMPGVAAIYAHYVEHTAITFDYEAPEAQEWRARLELAAGRGHPWLVSEVDGTVAGYAYAGPFRTRAAYAQTLETSIYVDHARRGQGIGEPLYAALLDELRSRNCHLVVAGMTLPNPGSQALHRRLGFVSVGVFEQIGYKLGAWHDVEFSQLRLSAASGSAPPQVPSAP